MLKYNCMEFLKDSTVPWVKYGLGKCDVSDVLKDERIKKLISDSKQKDDTIVKRHNDAKLPMHKIALLADMGLTKEQKEIDEIAQLIMSSQDEDGAFLSIQNVPINFGGSGVDEPQWVICDYPTLLYSLIKFGYKDDKRVQKSIEFLKSLVQDNGFRCTASIPKFGGPGKKVDHCPYGNLLALKVFSLLPKYHDEEFIKTAIDELFNMWDTQGERKYKMFGIGTDFRKLKFPNVWFGVVHVLSVLCKYDYARSAPQYKEMLKVIEDKQLESGGFIPESIFMNFKPFDFGQKKVESDTLTLQIYNIFVEDDMPF